MEQYISKRKPRRVSLQPWDKQRFLLDGKKGTDHEKEKISRNQTLFIYFKFAKLKGTIF